jgi:hypothetical protein
MHPPKPHQAGFLLAEQFFAGHAVDDRNYFVGFSAAGTRRSGGFIPWGIAVAVFFMDVRRGCCRFLLPPLFLWWRLGSILQ